MRKNVIGIIGFCVIALLTVGCDTSDEVIDDVNKASIEQEETLEDTDMLETDAPVIEERITIKDPVLEQMIREQLDKPEGELTTLDMEMLYSININYEKNPVNEISGLEYAVNLNDFSFSRGTLKSLNPVVNLQNLFYLNVSYAEISDPIADFDAPALERVGFIETNVAEYDFLKNLTAVSSIIVTDCNLSDIGFMQNWENLTDVYLTYNAISDLEPLRGKDSIISLNIHMNNVVSIDALSTLTNLQSLNISYNHVADITPIMQLTKLIELTAYEELDQKIIDRGLLENLRSTGIAVQYAE
ncbi:hypothetical protein QE109_14930 [Fusibacter bizertensis]|uniref:Leucine-rich repeat domain-containing protein n=1 Tax=Fusibacter bizertensis TaxID=1488331 RepID=A0ABT6NGB8_9FIRM|nr:hypothetical protein [Fusibacter bizertensis]MDH8679451.1 hypothetical protein [Fusibacter bizertensis]